MFDDYGYGFPEWYPGFKSGPVDTPKTCPPVKPDPPTFDPVVGPVPNPPGSQEKVEPIYIDQNKNRPILLPLPPQLPPKHTQVQPRCFTCKHFEMCGFKKDYLNREQIHSLLNSIDRNCIKGKRDYAICLLMLTTGMRTIEVSRAKIEDYDNGILHIQGKGRADKTEYVKISLQVENAINEYLETRKNKSANDYLFTSISNHNNEQQLTTKSVSRIAKENLINAGLKSRRLTAHSFRHTTATINLKAGATMQETQQLLRHQNINTTMIYSHNLERENNNSEQRIANYIFN